MKTNDDLTVISQGEDVILKRFVTDENDMDIKVNGLNIQAVFKTCDGYLVKKLNAVAVAQISTIQAIADVGGNLAGKFFFYDTTDNSYAFWIESGGNGNAPSVTGKTLVKITIAADDDADTVAAAIQAAMNGVADITSAVVTDTVTNTNDVAGTVQEPADGTGVNATGFSFLVTIKGSDLIEKSITVDPNDITICIRLTKEDTLKLNPKARTDFWVIVDFTEPTGRKSFENFQQIEVKQVGFNNLID